ncbi:hypothetical protein HMPREF1210_01134 [Paenisporosarcina sp. HGH0030]|uniref:hypothetical protein n=1 Tax=Paenisporosarcina sp. HGH0030 TaxID=1078085 RepID=UPI00034E3B50|nr:hypothetical protein [Paenisporosarcina sp. HGH0030]EPD52754.1 hypothetical protein HMPREF1210_01134 [Paenisporosarcina sp. HGH0030]
MKAIVSLIDGLPLKDLNAQIELTFDDQNFIIVEKGFSGFKKIAASTFTIPLTNIIDTLQTTEEEFVEKSKSVIGRGAAGGLLFGPAGLILGGLSGIGNKKSTKKSHLYVVSYVSSDMQLKNITFSMPSLMTGVTKKFDDQLHKKLKATTPNDLVFDYRNQEPQKEFNL